MSDFCMVSTEIVTEVQTLMPRIKERLGRVGLVNYCTSSINICSAAIDEMQHTLLSLIG